MARHGRYTILGKLADGGMAEIFLATQHGAEGFEKHVVLKRVLTQFSADPQFRNMFIDEAHISMSLQHSNIVQVLDLGVAGSRFFLVMELVDGWDLERILQRAHGAGMVFPPALALHVVTVVCRALAYAHAKMRAGKPLGIVHRDISPNNVLISEQGEIKLADFGIAKAQRKREQTAAGVIKGKVAYMSPEQATGTAIDRRSDIFSVGSLLYRMMTNALPFDAPTDLEQLLRVQKADVTPIEKVKPGLSPAVAAIVTRAMRLAPAERYQTADEMLADVERVLRTDFQSAGQTELKLWLEQLSRRDNLESIGKHRVDTSGIVKDVLGTDLSAGTSFELDEVHEITTGMTELSSVSGARPPPTPPPVVVDPKAARPDAADRSPRGPTPSPALTPPLVTAAVPPPRRRLGGFWLGAIFALGAVVGFRYLMGWADREGFMAKLGFGSDGHAGSGVMGPPEPPAAPPPPVAKQAEPAPVVVPAPAPAPPPAVDAATAVVVVAAERDAATPDANKPVAEDDDTDDADEEELLRKAVPNAEQAVIGADGAEPEKAAESKHAAPEASGPKRATKPKHETAILHLKTVPVGAIVKTKGQVLGRTPINLHFRTGNTYELTFVKNGYVLANRLVTVANAKDKTIAVALKKRPAPRKRSFFHPHR
ncbi:MAG TPA: serine/threonine-protein kinase [Polyangia bacterium]|nr:serine/threonine-protein kinase [Polyangia bacterium]